VVEAIKVASEFIFAVLRSWGVVLAALGIMTVAWLWEHYKPANKVPWRIAKPLVFLLLLVALCSAWNDQREAVTKQIEINDKLSATNTKLLDKVEKLQGNLAAKQDQVNQQQNLVNQYLLSNPRPDIAGLVKALAALQTPQSKPEPAPSPLKKRAKDLAAKMLAFVLDRSRSAPPPISPEEMGRRLATGETTQSIWQTESAKRSRFDSETAADFAATFGVEMVAVLNALARAKAISVDAAAHLRFECTTVALPDALQQCAEDIGAAADQLH
jgi:hypothetical protein